MRRHHLGSRTVLFRCANLESGRSAAGYRRITQCDGPRPSKRHRDKYSREDRPKDGICL